MEGSGCFFPELYGLSLISFYFTLVFLIFIRIPRYRFFPSSFREGVRRGGGKGMVGARVGYCAVYRYIYRAIVSP